MRTMIVALAVLIGLGGSGSARADYAAGLKAYKLGDYASAMSEFRSLAEQGNMYAQNSVGIMFYDGLGVTKDYKEAVKWYRKSAEQGHVMAQHNLGMVYEYGRGVEQDNKQSEKWYRMAAEQGYATAQFDLGVMYYRGGGGVSRNYVEALK